MSRAKLNALVNQHVNYWFHHERMDGGSPAITLKQCNELFLSQIRRMKLDTFCEDSYFRRAMCEAVCTMYVSEKEGTRWSGPHSDPPRPRDWSSGKERVWREYRDYHYLNSDFWHNFWSTIQEGMWEAAIPRWRMSYQNIAPHYIDILDDTIDEGAVNDMAKRDSGADDGHHHPAVIKSEYDSD